MASRHFHRSRWADFSRGLTSGRQAAAMRAHLDAGCSRCASTLAAQRRVAVVAAADAWPAPPAAAVRSIKALFALARPEHRSRLRSVQLKPTFDGALVPAAAGTRAAVAPARRLLFESTRFALDLHVTPRPRSRLADICGQLLEQQTGSGVAEVPALLILGDRILWSGVTAELGEFELTAELTGSPELWLLADERHPISARLGP